VRSSPKARQAKNKARLENYDRMVAEASGLSEAQARALLLQYGSVKKALEHAPKPE